MSELEASQAWLQRNLGGQLTGEYQVVLTEDASSMTKALVEYTELPQEKAESLAAHSLCVENGGLLVLNAGSLQNEQQRAFSLGMLMMRTYEGQVLADAKGCGYAWLIHGAAYLAGTSRQSAVSGYAVADLCVRTGKSWKASICQGQNICKARKISARPWKNMAMRI